MAAASSTQSPSRRQSLTTGDRLKTIEAKVVIIGAQGKPIHTQYTTEVHIKTVVCSKDCIVVKIVVYNCLFYGL